MITNPRVNFHWGKYTLSLTQSSLQPLTLTNSIQTMSQSINQTHPPLSNSVVNTANLITSMVYTYSTPDEASLRVAAFSQTNSTSTFERDKKGYLIGLQLKGNQVYLSDTNLNNIWNQHQDEFNSIFQQPEQPPSYLQTVSQLPSTLFASQLSQSTQLSSPIIYDFSTREEALSWIKAFSDSELTKGFPRDHYQFLKNLKLKEKEIRIYDANLDLAWNQFKVKQQDQTQILSPIYKQPGM